MEKRRKETERRDDDIMATNNSSIVSKRSVERLYFPHEPHFFRYFVKKPQRRSPLINRGYWLRMKAIDHTVQQFLEEPSEKNKFVINLGCGYDPLPWQSLSRHSRSCKNVQFIDIDYPLLMAKKRTAVLTTSELNSMLKNQTSNNNKDGIMFQSDQYIQIGCDLREIPTLSKILGSIFNFEDSFILFTAEVSITYMRLPYADSLIQWASTFPDARFCLLEQILPDGPSHPFAKTMLAHFHKLQTPLHSIELYPTTKSQESRFKDRGWSTAKARNLWELWNSLDFLTSEQRMSLDEIEPFDEWEEFALFGEHYFLLIASKSFKSVQNGSTIPLDNIIASNRTLKYTENPAGQGRRRFGATLLPMSSPSVEAVANHAGMGLDTRMSSVDIYTLGVKGVQGPNKGPSPRQCHTITDLEDSAILIGGRTSPDNALSDCWRYHKNNRHFERLQDLPVPRFRHSAIAIDKDLVLVVGGKSNSKTIVEDCLILYKSGGWKKIRQIVIGGEVLRPSCGATMFNFNGDRMVGILIGGILKDGTLSTDVWIWNVVYDIQTESFSITFSLMSDTPISRVSCLARFGASVATDVDKVYIVGGMARSLLTAETEIVELSFVISRAEPSIKACHLKLDDGAPRPLLIGTSVASVQGDILIMGGGAVCFSMGTFSNGGCYTIMREAPTPEGLLGSECTTMFKPWRLLENIVPDLGITKEGGASEAAQKKPLVSVTVPRISINNFQDFDQIMRAAKPIIIEGLDIGSCTSLWSPNYLKERIGNDRPVVVHEATTKTMDFQTKNFRYTTKPFGDFIDSAAQGGKLYLRALSEEKPSELPTNLACDFPSISNDFRLPPELQFVIENAHSSPLRISGDIAMWLHYDVMANILCQISGTKCLLLYPPKDIHYLQFPPGSSSSSIDVFSPTTVTSPLIHPHQAILKPGDVLFLPPLWPHAAAPTTKFSIAVNVFFRNLEHGYAAGRDVYGNRDLAAYEKGRTDVARIGRAFERVPLEMREFYLGRLADELRGIAGGGA